MTRNTSKPKVAAAKTAGQQRGRPFPKGESGNPLGRPLGSRHRVTLALDALLDGEPEKITRKAVEMAPAGDGVALRLCLDRIAPAGRRVAAAAEASAG